MAKCYSCNETIPFFTFSIKRGIYFFKKNLFRRKNFPIFECPHCEAECQESLSSFYTFLFIFIALTLLILISMKRMNIELPPKDIFMFGGLFYFGALRYLWWKTYATVNEPINSWIR